MKKQMKAYVRYCMVCEVDYSLQAPNFEIAQTIPHSCQLDGWKVKNEGYIIPDKVEKQENGLHTITGRIVAYHHPNAYGTNETMENLRLAPAHSKKGWRVGELNLVQELEKIGDPYFTFESHDPEKQQSGDIYE